MRQGGEAARHLGLADPGGADHDDVLGGYLVAQFRGQLLAPPAVAQRNRHGALGVVLPNDVFVQFLNDLTRGEGIHTASC